MSLESDRKMEEGQGSPPTMFERYTDEEHSVISPIPEDPPCQCCHYNEHENMMGSETESFGIQQDCSECCHHHKDETSLNQECVCSQSNVHECPHIHEHEHVCCQHEGNECPHNHEHDEDQDFCHYHHLPHWSTITMSDDDIQIITDPEYYRHFDDLFYIEPIVARSLLSEYLIKEPTPSNLRIHVDTRTKRQRFIARTVMIVSMVMLCVSVLLVIISLIMSDHIDNLVRSANSDILKFSSSPKTVTSATVTLIIGNGTIHNSTLHSEQG